MDQSPVYSFTALDTNLACLSAPAAREQLLQYNLDKSLAINKYRFYGSFVSSSASDYDQVLKDFFASASCLTSLGAVGTPALPLEFVTDLLNLTVMNMDFFNNLKEAGIVGENGNIRGCFDECFDGITVSDQLRELLINEDSENACIFSESEKKEFIFQLFRLFVIGGALCQPDTNIERYLELTKSFYKEITTIYKDARTNQVQLSGRVFLVRSVAGVNLFPANPSSPHNILLLMVDPLKKVVTVVKNSFMPFW